MIQPLFSSVFSKFEAIMDQSGSMEQILQETSALLQSAISHYDWVGFYVLEPTTNMLLLGPYTGKPTEHTHIPVGKGICGQVAANCRSMIVQDVTQQSNYLACSLDVQSEIVVPILKHGKFVAEIDIDSHALAPFTTDDEAFLTDIANRLAGCF